LNDVFDNVFIVLHNTHAVSKVIDTAQVVYGLGFDNFIVTKAEGSAAQTGVPEANKLAMKMNRRFMVLPGLKDVIELLDIEKPLLITSPVLTKERVDLISLKSSANSKDRLVVVVSGSNSSFSRKEMDLGECASLDAKIDIGPSGTIAVILYGLLE
jgi:SpoU rRNA methylase family enzyme